MTIYLLFQEIRNLMQVQQVRNREIIGPFKNVFFIPAHSCHRKWRNLTSPLERNQCTQELLKRILLVVPLIFATLVAYLIAIAGFMTCKVAYKIIPDENRIIVVDGIIPV